MVIYRISSKIPRRPMIGWLIIFVVCCLFNSCGGGELEATDQTGSLSFQVQWENAGTSSVILDNPDEVADLAELNCEEEGVFWVNVILYDQTNQYIYESDPPWQCSAHGGTINVPAGSGRKVAIFGENAANEILYRGIKSNINIFENRITDAGLIVARYFVPTGGNTTNCETTVNHSWQAVYSATSYEFQLSTDVTFARIEGSMMVTNPQTGCIPRPNTSGHYWRVRAIDFDGLIGAWSQIWVYGTPSEAPPAPIGGISIACEPYPYHSFAWQAVQSATSYEFQLSRDIAFASLRVNVFVDAPGTICYDLPYGGNPYFWRVRSIGDNGLTSGWSFIWTHNTPG